MDTVTLPRPSRAPARAAAISVGVAILVLAGKTVAWRLTGSAALMADALESIVNVFAAAAALWALRVSAEPPDEEHPFGHGKAEYFSAGLEGGLILVAAGGIIWQSVPRLLEPIAPESLGLGASLNAAASGANAALGVWLLKKGRVLHSPALVADGRHVLSDVVTSAGALAGILVAAATGWWILDPICAVLVALNIVRVGIHVVRGAFGGLMDQALEPEEVAAVEAAAKAAMAPALELHDLRTRRAAHTVFVDFHLVVPGTMTVRESHEICDHIEAAIEALHPGAHATIHVEPPEEAHGDHEEG